MVWLAIAGEISPPGVLNVAAEGYARKYRNGVGRSALSEQPLRVEHEGGACAIGCEIDR